MPSRIPSGYNPTDPPFFVHSFNLPLTCTAHNPSSPGQAGSLISWDTPCAFLPPSLLWATWALPPECPPRCSLLMQSLPTSLE